MVVEETMRAGIQLGCTAMLYGVAVGVVVSIAENLAMLVWRKMTAIMHG